MNRIKNLFSFEGRTRRTPFVRFTVFSVFLVWLATLADERLIAPNLCHINEDWICYLPGEVGAGNPLAIAMLCILAVPLIAIMVRRLHDQKKSGWWLLAAFTGIGILPLLYWFLSRTLDEAPPTST